MRRPRTLVGSAVPLVLLIGLVGLVPSAAASAAPPDDDARAVALLRRALVAASSLGYSGTQVVSSWRPGGDTSRLVSVQQWPDGRRVEKALDSAGTATGAAPSRQSAAGALDLPLRALSVLAGGYRLAVLGGDRVAGRAATVVSAERDGRVAARMWVDDQTGLLLRQEVLDDDGSVRRMFCFLELRVGPPPAAAGADAVVPSARSSAAPPRVRTMSGALVSSSRGSSPAPAASRAPSSASASASAWRAAAGEAERRRWCDLVGCPAELPSGFRLLDVRRGTASGVSVVQLVYGDGLSSTSVFGQPGRLDAEHLTGFRADTWDGAEVYVGDGWPARITWQGGGHVFTAVSDASADDLHAAITSFPHDRVDGDSGPFAIIGRGMHSVLEWLQGD
jgi:hypothetical protein